MPGYSFICQKCKNKFSLEATFAEYNKKGQGKFKCPRCDSRRTKRVFGEVFFIRSTPKIRCSCGG